MSSKENGRELERDPWLSELLAPPDGPPAIAPPFTTPDVIRFASRRRVAPGIVTALLVAWGLGGLLLWTRAQEPEPAMMAARGASPTPALRLRYALEGEPLGALAVRRGDGGDIAPGERVVFVVESATAGFLCLEERGPSGWQRLLPSPRGRWRVEPGLHLATDGAAVQAFRTDLGAGVRRYRAIFDPVDAACAEPLAEATLELNWSP